MCQLVDRQPLVHSFVSHGLKYSLPGTTPGIINSLTNRIVSFHVCHLSQIREAKNEWQQAHDEEKRRAIEAAVTDATRDTEQRLEQQIREQCTTDMEHTLQEGLCCVIYEVREVLFLQKVW